MRHTWLPNHAVFLRLQEGRENQGSAETEKPASSLPSSPPLPPQSLTRNLLSGLAESSFCGTRAPSGPQRAGEEPSLSQYQRWLCRNPPLFEIYQALLNPAQHHVALTGIKGLMILELPKRWGKNSEFFGKSAVNCSTTPVAERFFTSSTSLTVKHAPWYPRELLGPHIVPLTSDDVIRIYPLREPQTATTVIVLSEAEEESLILNKGRAYTTSLGETAVAFDFGPLSAVPKHNEETFLTLVSLLPSPGSVGKLLGPLPMHPAAEDNYGYDACAVLCLPCVANVLVITTESGMLHHCVVLEGEEDNEQTSEKSWDSRADLIPSLYVFVCVELEQDEPFDSDFSCPMKLHRDSKCPLRYHYTQEAGVHSVGLTWIHKLHKFLGSDEEDKDSLQELATEQKCFVEHILPCSQPAPFQGFWIIPDILGPTMICITSTYEYLLRPLLSRVHPDVEMAESPLPFAVYVANPAFLKSSEKDTAPPPEACLQLISRATQVFREYYILKQDLAKEDIQRRIKLLYLNCCREDRKSLREMAERLANKYEEAKEKQEDIMKRMKKVLHSFQSQLPVLSDNERDMKKELYPPLLSAPTSEKCIQSILKENGEHIREMVKQINGIQNHVNF
ncbi:hypothetical protein K5549_021479 [Capra hircus]|nr:hypothetical protein K5549_021479 [Capra hircus]